MSLKKYQKKAFSLIELSIVIILVAVVFSGAIAVYTASINNQKIKNSFLQSEIRPQLSKKV